MIDHPTPSLRRNRFILAVVTLTITISLSSLYWASTASHWPLWLGLSSVSLFTWLTYWVAFGFVTAMLGLGTVIRAPHILEIPDGNHRGSPTSATVSHPEAELDETPRRVALVVPIYNEDPAAVFACVQSSAESLARLDDAKRFEFFILSDTTDPECWLREEVLWAEVRSALGPSSPPIHYRHRTENHGRKEGNIAEFLERWGLDYQYFLILDADSTMDGRTLSEMAHRMDADPRLGILQAPPIPEGGCSVWARLQQFSARVYGPLFMAGLNAWAGSDGNYWGHNAMIRTLPFLRHCGLSKLPGKEPLGGQILSHDFVEAALMRRAGYRVQLAVDLGGGYEQCPTTIEDHARRDQRWCQGNLQHLRIAAAPAIHPVSRLHLLSGANSYLMSPIWGIFLAITATGLWFNDSKLDHPRAIAVFGTVMLLLLLPKFVATATILYRGSCDFGGPARLVVSCAVEIISSILVAPIMMLYHTRFVVLNLMGRKVQWGKQQRVALGISWMDAVRSHSRHCGMGLVVLGALGWFAPGLVLWASPILVGLCFAVVTGKWMASPQCGGFLQRLQLLAVPEELRPPRVLRRRDVLQRRYGELSLQSVGRSLFAQTVQIPSLYRLHQSLLVASQSPPATSSDATRRLSKRLIRRSCRTLKYKGVDAIPLRDRRSLLGSADAMRKLHHTYWVERATPA